MAALESLKREFSKNPKKHLRSVFDSATLTADGSRVEISRAGGYSRRCHFDSPVDRRESGRKPAQTFRETVRGMAVETGQRRFARYGLPRLVAYAAPGRRDRITAHPLPNSQPLRPAGNSRTDADRHDADRRRPQGTPAGRVATGAAHGRRVAVQQPDGAVSLFKIRTTGGGAPEISGLGAGTSHRVPGVEFGAAPSGQPGPLYRLERRGEAPQHPLHCLQYSFSHSALGSRSASGVTPSRPHGSGTF